MSWEWLIVVILAFLLAIGIWEQLRRIRNNLRFSNYLTYRRLTEEEKWWVTDPMSDKTL